MTDPDLQNLIAELDLPLDDELSALLEGLRDLGEGPVPQPSPAVADLLLASGAGRPVRSRRRTAIISAIVLVSLGTGATAAAADPLLRQGAADAVAAVAQVVRAAPEHPAKAAPPAAAVPRRQAAIATTASGSPGTSSRHPVSAVSARGHGNGPSAHHSASDHHTAQPLSSRHGGSKPAPKARADHGQESGSHETDTGRSSEAGSPETDDSTAGRSSGDGADGDSGD